MRLTQYLIFFCLTLFSKDVCNASPTEELRTNLQASARTGVLFGHHDDTLYGHNWKATEQGRSDVYDVSQMYPALLSFDLGGFETGKISYRPLKKERIIDEVASQHKRGGYVMFSWHATNPATLGNAWDTTNKDVVSSILPGGSNNERYCSYLDSLAVFFKSLKDDNGNPIGVLFRPFHEFQWGHFWWSINYCKDNQFVELWRYTVDYLREKNVNNLLYVFSPSTNFYSKEEYLLGYPGDKYVDVLACELYHYQLSQNISTEDAREEFVSRMQRYLSILDNLSKAKRKLYAISETGIRYGQDPQWWTQAILPSMEGYAPCFINVWRNGYHDDKETYCTYPGDVSEEDFIEFSRSEKMIFLNEDE